MVDAYEKDEIISSNHTEDFHNILDLETTANTVDPKVRNKQVIFHCILLLTNLPITQFLRLLFHR